MTRPGHWPSPDGLRILRLALLDGDAVVRGWDALRRRPGFDLDQLDPGSFRLIPLLERNLRRHGLENPWADRMRGVYRYWWAHNQLLLRRLATVLEALHAEAVPTMVLKGAAVGTRYYGDPGLRPMSDADLLVPRDRVADALAVARGVGWSPESVVDEGFVRMRHAVSLRDVGGSTMDLHWAIHEDDCRPRADDGCWASAVPVEVAGVPTRMLDPAPLMVHASAHGSKWAADPGIRWIADAVLIIGAGGVDWDALYREATDRRFVVRIRSCLAYLKAALDQPVPDEIMQRFAGAPVGAFERLEHQVRVRRHERLGELPRYWFAYRRSGASGDFEGSSFGRYLQYAWGLPSVRDLPVAATQRALRRLRSDITVPSTRGA